MRALAVLREEDAFSDVVREAQELVELCLKVMLRQVGVDPPHWHDVRDLLPSHESLFPEASRPDLAELVRASRHLKRDRELSFDGAIDFIPTEEDGPTEADQALAWAQQTLDAATRLIGKEPA